MVPAITTVLDRLTEQVQQLELERALLNVAPPPASLVDRVDLQHTLLDDDEMRLNALLQGVGYVIVCDGASITVDEPHIHAGGERQVYEYKGSQRSTETYRVIENNRTEHYLDMPNSKRVAVAIADFEATPITQHLR
ncbi:recombinase family protein, partial [Pseudomonas sp. MWU13-2860]